MKVVLFYHTLVSDWNHGNAHFLRGIATELVSRGHTVSILEPSNSWSRLNLVSEYGEKPIKLFHEAYPLLSSAAYDPGTLDLDTTLEGADLVIVHEWSDHSLVQRIGEHRRHTPGYKLLFHDTHHRMITDRQSMDAYDLTHYDGVLAYGKILADLYRETQRVPRVWTWHEAADTRVFKPILNQEKEGDLVWVGNWGDEERTQELHEFLIGPAKSLSLKARIYGVRYPAEAQSALVEANIQYGGWLANFDAPAVFSQFKFTVHVPRRPYLEALPGIPTIRPFEALACGIPLICSPWHDTENLFTPGKDFLVARNGLEMREQMQAVLQDSQLSASLAQHGLETIRRRHTCKHRVDELLRVYQELTFRAGSFSPSMALTAADAC
ncbi:MAG TPA: glycosyltransferase [Verrucomicrobiae bacterium]|nr:glycosyltransferase [Verrucomicrobiae bacterium]